VRRTNEIETDPQGGRIRRLGVRASLAAAAVCLALAACSPGASKGVRFDRLLADKPAETLSAYGLFQDAAGKVPSAGVTPYHLNTPLFSDYAEKSRFVALPPETRATYTDEDVFEFPVGATLVKTFSYPADFRKPGEQVRVLETRLLIHKADGWVALPYVWNAEGTEAKLARGGARMDVSFIDPKGQAQSINYHVPNQNQCKTCHSADDDIRPIGPRAHNLNGDFPYAGGAENQLAHWTRVGLLEGAPAPADAPYSPHWDREGEGTVADRARAYLDANCGHCHKANGSASNTGLYLTWEESNPSHLGVMKRPVAAGRGSGDNLFGVFPGKPDESILVFRMESREPGVMMPELGRALDHTEGVDLIRQWIAGMPEPQAGGVAN
jgi:uncharacterized repeat protein (TIGR03806 family)